MHRLHLAAGNGQDSESRVRADNNSAARPVVVGQDRIVPVDVTVCSGLRLSQTPRRWLQMPPAADFAHRDLGVHTVCHAGIPAHQLGTWYCAPLHPSVSRAWRPWELFIPV
jgi:hypothetical protein